MDALKSLFEQLVNTEDKMERMNLVESFEMPEMGEQVDEEVSDMKATIEDLNAQIADLQATIEEKDQRYIDTFFGGDKEGENNPENKKKEKPDEEKKSLDEIEKDLSKK